MSLIAKGTPAVAPVPEGTYIARCVQIIDLGTQHSQVYDNEARKVMIRWELPQETFKTAEGNEQPRLIHAVYTNSLNEKASLRKMLEGWRSKKFTEEELAGFDLSKLISLPCMVTITHTVANNGNKYANITAVAALPKGMEAPPQVNESIIFDIDNPADEPKYNVFPEFVQKMISNSNEYSKTASLAEEEPFPPTDDLPF